MRLTAMTSQPLVTVIVPTKNSARTLAACLASVRAQTHAAVELIVVDHPDSTDATREIAARYADTVLVQGPERCSQRNAGAKAAKGEYVAFIDSDMTLSPGVIAECVERVSAAGTVAVVIPEESFGDGFWAQCKRLERSFYVGVEWMEAARFFRREAFDAVGGYDESLVSGEDWDLARRAGALGNTARCSAKIMHDEGSLSLQATLRKKRYYAQKFSAYAAKRQHESAVAKQAGVLRRYALFFSRPRKLLADPLLGAGMLFMKTCEFGAGALGLLSARRSGGVEVKERLMLVVSQEFLPSLGGKEASVDKIARLSAERGIASVEVIANEGDAAECATFDAAYPLPVFRVRSPLIAIGKRLQGSVKGEGVAKHYGGSKAFSVRQKLGLYFNTAVRLPLIAAAVRRRLRAHPHAAVLVNAHDYVSVFAAVCVRALSRRRGRIAIVYVQGFIAGKTGVAAIDWCVRRLFSAVDGVLCVSAAAEEAMISAVGTDPARTSAYRLWIRLDGIGEPDAVREYADPLRVVFAGRIVPNKGVGKLMELARHLETHGLAGRYRLTLIGDSDDAMRDELRRFAERSHALRWAGGLRKPAYWEELKQHDVLVLPSLWTEGSGNVLVEGAACGLALVGSRVGGIPETASPFPLHRIVDEVTPAALLAALDDLRADMLRLGRAAVVRAQREAALAHFSERNFDVHERLYRELLTAVALRL